MLVTLRSRFPPFERAAQQCSGVDHPAARQSGSGMRPEALSMSAVVIDLPRLWPIGSFIQWE
jgi:hypothetical protein